MRLSSKAIEALQEAAEAILVIFFEGTNFSPLSLLMRSCSHELLRL